MARVNTNTPEGIAAASRTLPKANTTVNTTTLEGILAASAPKPAPVVDPRAALAKLTGGQTLTDDEKRLLGLTVTPETSTTVITPNPSASTWVKASTVNTANGPVDVDANGLAADGSRPVAVVVKSPDGLAAGFTAGPFPKELEQFFGSSAGVIGYRIITNEDGSQSLEVSDAPGSSRTYGFKFTKDNTGKYVPFKTSGSGGGNGNGLGTSTTTSQFGPGSPGYEDRKSAYDLLMQEFQRYGLGALVEPLKGLVMEGVSPSEFGLRLQQTDAYKKRFAANQERINKGLRSLTPAEYIGLEDQYQNIMRNYGLPASYYTKDSMGTQEGFNKFLANDVSAAELEDRIATAQKRVLNTNPEVLQALKQFYPDLNNSDILAYTLDPARGLEEIKRKVTAAEIGGAALAQGLQASGGTAEALAGYGITKAQAQQGYQTIGEFLPTAQKLGDIYAEQGLGGYDQATAEREVFGTAGAASAAQKRRKLAQLEQATFGGQAGTSQGAFDRGRQGTF